MLQTIESINNVVNNFIWGVPAMICIIGVGLYLSLRTGFVQIRKFPYALKTTLGRIFKKKEASDGSMTPFQAVCTALAGTCLLYTSIPGNFIQIHQSYLINFDYIEECSYESVKMKNGDTIPISQPYRKSVRKQLAERVWLSLIHI